MSWTRFRNDPARLTKEMEISTYSGRYFLNTPGQGDHMPYLEDCHIRLQQYGANIDQTHFLDINNELRGITQKLTRDQIKHTKLLSTCMSRSMSNPYPTISPFTKESRSSDPAWVLRDKDMEYLRWEQPWLSPQTYLELPFEHSISTQQQAKQFKNSIPNSSTQTLISPNVNTLSSIVDAWLPSSMT
jgi:hypothetical protein